MLSATTFVSSIVRPSAAAGGGVVSSNARQRSGKIVLRFANGRRAWYHATDRRAPAHRAILDVLQTDELPVYVEVSDADELAQVLVPMIVTVVSLRRGRSRDVVVQLSPSNAVHILKSSHPRYHELLAELEAALRTAKQFAVTETADTQEIHDVRPFEEIPLEPPATAAASLPAHDVIETLTEISDAEVERFFEHVAANTCSAGCVKSPCIPFLFPDDGCHGRAHMVCELLQERFGIVSGKIWLYGHPDEPYEVATCNHPRGSVLWLYHVAPIIRCTSGIRVVDPALFRGPVRESSWRRKQFNAGTVVLSEAAVFDRLRPGARIQRDPGLKKTRRVLGAFRAKLASRIRRHRRAPPYC